MNQNIASNHCNNNGSTAIAIRKRIEVLKYNQIFMSLIGIYSYRLTEPTNEFIKSKTAYLFVTTVIAGILMSIAYILVNYTDVAEFQVALVAVAVIIGAAQTGGAYTNVGLKMKQVKVLHLKLQEIVDEGD